MAALLSLLVLVIFTGLTALVVYRRLNWERHRLSDRYNNKTEGTEGTKAPSIVPAVILPFVGLALLIVVSGITQIEPGRVGVVATWGKVNEYTLQPGISYVVPVANNVTILNTQVQVYEFAELEGATSDLQAVRLTGSVNYRIDSNTAWRLFRDVGVDFESKVFTRPAETALKTITPRYTAQNIISKRDEIAREATAQLLPSLAQYGISVEAFYVSNIGLNPAFMAAVEEKQIADQQVLTQQQITRQRLEQQKQVLAEAEGRANAQRAQAAGEADAIKALANAQAEANKKLQSSLTPELIQYTLINKLAPTINTLILPSGQEFILDPKALTAQ